MTTQSGPPSSPAAVFASSAFNTARPSETGTPSEKSTDSTDEGAKDDKQPAAAPQALIIDPTEITSEDFLNKGVTLGVTGAQPGEKITIVVEHAQGKVDRYAPMSIKGKLTPFDPLNSLDIATRFKNVELTTITPYSGKFAGYRIRKGRLNLDLHYRIEKGQLNADNKVLVENLQLGERVDSPDAVDLPIRLAVALLKDTQGRIALELPVKGDLNNPEFSVMPIVWQTLRNLVLRTAQAPFKFIAGLVGGSDADAAGCPLHDPQRHETSRAPPELEHVLGCIPPPRRRRPDLWGLD